MSPLWRTHFSEKLATDHGIRISRETVRKIRREAGISPKRRRMPPQASIPSGSQAPGGHDGPVGDGSAHRWFGPPPCCLLAAIDDATSLCLVARFFPFESSQGYPWVLRRMLTEYGIPMAIYQDRHSALKRNDGSWTLEEQLRGRQDPSI